VSYGRESLHHRSNPVREMAAAFAGAGEQEADCLDCRAERVIDVRALTSAIRPKVRGRRSEGNRLLWILIVGRAEKSEASM
jgi:hypothetical protein